MTGTSTNFGKSRSETRKSVHSEEKTRNISDRDKTELLLAACIKSHTGYHFLAELMTLNDM